MQPQIIKLILSGLFFAAHLNAAEPTTDPLKLVTSADPNERIKGFYDLIAPEVISGRITYTCKFNTTDVGKAKKLLGQLLRKESTFDFDKDYFERYGFKIVGKELYARKKEKKVMEYLYAKEGQGEYLAHLQDFMDSCEDESLIDIFPGTKTFNRYLQKSTEAAFKKIEEIKNADPDIKYKTGDVLIFLGDAAIKNKETRPQLYNKVKAKLIELSENDCLAGTAIGVMSGIGDPDFIPILEKISRYDDSKGCVIVSNGEKTLLPVASDAKRALKRLQMKNIKVRDLTKSTTAQ